MLVNGELGYELDSGLSSLPGRGPEPERDDKLSLPGAGPAKTNKQRDGQRNVEGRSFTLLSVRHLSRMLLLLLLLVVVKRSSGKGCITTSCNENSTTYRIGYDMLSANDSIYSLPCILG